MIGVYARLAKLDVFDYYLALPVVWALLAPAYRTDPAALATLVLFGLGTVAVLASGVALDDVTGYLDGSDARNYGPDAPARRLARKPLLTGELTVGQARRFGVWSGVCGAACWLSAWLVAPAAPAWSLLIAAFCLVISTQYSYGLKLSYRGGQELTLIGYGIGVVLAPYVFVTGHADAHVVVCAVLFGLGPLLFGLYSNTNDVAGDASVGRRTAAALLSPAANRRVVLGATVAEPALILGAAFTGPCPAWFPLLLAPVLIVRARQLFSGWGRGDILAARRTGIHAHRLTAVLLTTFGLIVGGL
ncbi:UbiA family prenyltransferase [Catenuloplanes japonicus]|uniref:UbiA family prenyltransferase n=1 Tax=Catenuloplanes japonicus TaxID=33876 RepID=UPI0005260945|nr:UbiA family prenyltransferase [Catenuloplanes japonicus]